VEHERHTGNNDLGLHDNIVGIIEQLLGPDLKMFRNALLLKPPRVGSQKGMHQDSPYWPIQPMELCSCWFALDDATLCRGKSTDADPRVPNGWCN
jgi:ectoine hydroxylase-related dioxygenase (phytanoyl-CoA dioxygenase family)